MDVSNPENPQRLREIPTEGCARGILIQDTLLYLCDGYEGLKVYSISEPLNPVIIGQCEDLLDTRKIDIQDGFAYVTNERGGFNIIDISDPRNPSVTCYYQERVFINTDEIKVFDNYAFVTKITGNHFFVFEISDPQNPRMLDTVFVSERNYPCSVSIKDNLLIAVSYPGLKIYSLNNPENLELIGEYEGRNYVTGKEILFYEEFAILSGQYIYIMDISDPENPEYVSETRRGAWGEPTIMGNSLALNSHYVFLADGIGRMSVLNIVNPRNPETVWEHVNGREYGNVETNGEYVYLVDQVDHYRQEDEEQYKHLVSFDVHDPNQPELISEIDNLAYGLVHSMIKSDNQHLFITSVGAPSTIGVVNIDEPQNPILTGRIRGRHPLFGECRGDYFYVSRVHEGIYIYNISNPLEPEFIREYQYIGEDRNIDYVQDLTLEGEFLYASDAQYGLRIYRFNGPEELELISITDFNASIAGCIIAREGYIYANSGAEVLIISVDDPESPQIIERIDAFPHRHTELEIDSGILYVPEMNNGIKLYSLEEPSSPELIGFIETPGCAVEISVFDNYLYLADYWDFGIYDVSRARGVWYLGLSEESHDFGEIYIDSLAEWSIDITNNSRLAREITNIIIESEVFSCEFAESFSLGSEGDTTLIVTFLPQADTTYSSALTIVSEDRELAIELSGKGLLRDDVRETKTIPMEFALYEPFPNPFNSTTTFSYDLPTNSRVVFKVFDLLGRKAAVIHDMVNVAGKHKIIWDASDLTAGVFFCRMEVKNYVSTVKLVLIK